MSAPRTQAGGDPASIELELLLEAIHRCYALDFRSYARASLRRRLFGRMAHEGLDTLSALQARLLRDPECMERLLVDLSINVTALFRDPSFFVAFRERVVPMLHTYPFLRVWVAGCATGEEVYSLAILLEEHGLYERTRIYATDVNDALLERASGGAFALEKLRGYTDNYIRGGGLRALSDYYADTGEGIRLDASLSRNVVFARHNLVSDHSFNEFHVVLCRNVMIYFDKALQARAHRVFYESLTRFGVLALGRRESIAFTPHADRYQEIDAAERLFRVTM